MGICGSIPRRGRSVHVGSRAHPYMYPVGTGSKMSVAWQWPLPPSSVKFKNEHNCNSTPLHACKECTGTPLSFTFRYGMKFWELTQPNGKGQKYELGIQLHLFKMITEQDKLQCSRTVFNLRFWNGVYSSGKSEIHSDNHVTNCIHSNSEHAS